MPEVLFFEISGYINGESINDALDKLMNMCSNHGIIKDRIEVLDPITGDSCSTTVSIGHEEVTICEK
jgi:hypothetical protein